MFTNAKYIKDPFMGNISCINVDINGVTCVVPLSEDNGDYREIMRQLDAGELVITEPE